MNANPTDRRSEPKQFHLPEPDTENITVLTRELPNNPILPWHHYDSPWLDAERPEVSVLDGETSEFVEIAESQEVSADEESDETVVNAPMDVLSEGDRQHSSILDPSSETLSESSLQPETDSGHPHDHESPSEAA